MANTTTVLRLLLIEDELGWIEVIRPRLVEEGYEVEVAKRGLDGLAQARKSRPDLIIVDLGLPDVDGLTLAQQMRRDPQTQAIPIMILTNFANEQEGLKAGADAYATKTAGMDVIVARIEALMRMAHRSGLETGTLAIYCKHEQPLQVRVDGAVGLRASTRMPLALEPNEFSRTGLNALLSREWPFETKKVGKDLYNRIFVQHAEVMSTYWYLLGLVKSAEHLRLRIECNRGDLGIPYEFLHDPGANEEGFHFALRHPIARRLLGLTHSEAPFSSSFLSQLGKEPLKVLLIASNTLPNIPAVDEEIAHLETHLPDLFSAWGIKTSIDVLPTAKASYDKVVETLRECKHHIVHYSGHGNYCANPTHLSSLYFWEKPGQSQITRNLNAAQLENLFRGSDTRFVYLSCCYGMRVGPTHELLSNDFLGIADGIAHSGVPSVLGFRRAVPDAGARDIAIHFYRALAECREVDLALLHARREIHGSSPDDVTWMAPILIHQG